MASLLNWDETRRATLRIAASLSQLGMLRLPRGLATKTGRLTDKERALLQSHVQYAKEMLEHKGPFVLVCRVDPDTPTI